MVSRLEGGGLQTRKPAHISVERLLSYVLKVARNKPCEHLESQSVMSITVGTLNCLRKSENSKKRYRLQAVG